MGAAPCTPTLAAGHRFTSPLLVCLDREIRTVLLADDPGTRRIRAARAGRCRCRLCRCRPIARTLGRRREGVASVDGRTGSRPSAIRATVPEGGPARNRADREYPAVPRSAPAACAARRIRPPVDASTATDHRGSGGRNPRLPPPDRERALLRRPARRGCAPREASAARTAAEVPRLVRTRAGGQHAGPATLSRGQRNQLRRSLTVPDHRGTALCVPAHDATAGKNLAALRRPARTHCRPPGACH